MAKIQIFVVKIEECLSFTTSNYFLIDDSNFSTCLGNMCSRQYLKESLQIAQLIISAICCKIMYSQI